MSRHQPHATQRTAERVNIRIVAIDLVVDPERLRAMSIDIYVATTLIGRT